MQKYLRLFALLVIFPLVHLGLDIIALLLTRSSLSIVPLRFFLETIAVLTSPLQRLNPAWTLDITQATPTTYALLGMGVVMLWVLGSWVIIALIRRIPRRLLISGAVLLTVGLLTLIMLTNAPISTEAHITVDITQTQGQFTHYRQSFSQGGEGQMPQVGYFETAMSELASVQPRYIRIDHLYDYYDVVTMQGDTLQFDWTQLDRIVDAIIASGAEPFMSLSYAPPVLAADTVYAAPNDLALWGEVVYQTVVHYNVERGLNITYWEVWNEPNYTHFWADDIPAYLDLYTVTAQAVKRADSSAKVGGLGLASSAIRDLGLVSGAINEQAWIRALFHHVQTNHLPLDFVSWHFYDTDPANYTWNIALYQQWTAHLQPQPELILSEWNYAAGASPNYDNGRTNAYVAATIAQFVDSPLTYAFYFEPIDGTLPGRSDGRWGLLYADGQRKPAFAVFELLHQLDGERISTLSTHPDVGILATRTGDTIRLLLWNTSVAARQVSVQLDGITAPITANRQLLLPEGELTSDSLANDNPVIIQSLAAHTVILLEFTIP